MTAPQIHGRVLVMDTIVVRSELWTTVTPKRRRMGALRDEPEV
jgi:hypothetical protein